MTAALEHKPPCQGAVVPAAAKRAATPVPTASGAAAIASEVVAVVWDFDGVVVDTEWAVYQAWQEVCAAHGGDLPLAEYVNCVGSDHATWDPKAHLEKQIGRQLDWPPILEAKNQRTRDLLVGSGPMPGVASWLDRLRRAEVPQAVASSSTREWVGGWLERLGLGGYFHSLHCRGEVLRLKPAPDLFLAAAESLGVPPRHILAVEDSRNGVVAAKQAGMHVLAVPNQITGVQDLSEADLHVESLDSSAAMDLLAAIVKMRLP